ncbi:hypothetical protein AVEN_5431-1 [Araneus ventricosus]|uniref:Uncharacterized protein n=1 Tax=Araneus ventricosus TaxID=182803 RepID=A0A4Y2VHQ7_ARAVE|nr:hypothetical protein AVEN_5431-1 [Araneus ventricosus]
MVIYAVKRDLLIWKVTGGDCFPRCPCGWVVVISLCGEEKAIEDFISQKSLNLLKKLNIGISFLNISPDLWDKDDSYLKSQEIFQNLRVDNATAERGVKLMQDFNGLLTVDEEQKQFLLQYVEDPRKQYPDCKKATLKRKFD